MEPVEPVRDQSLYRVVWRWHFIAGLIVLPILVMMALTGGLYLFKPELDHMIYRVWEDVRPQSAAAPPSALIAATEAATGGKVLEITLSDRADRAARLLVRASTGEALTAFADPYTGRFLGVTAYGGVMQTIRKLHSLQKFGFWASSIIELAAGWAIVLVGTGVFLWWPRGRAGGVATIRGTPASRVFWRDVHAVTGACAALVILFLAVTGMPWSMVWGTHVQNWTTRAGWGEPKAPAEVMPEFAMSATVSPAAPAQPAPHHHGDDVKPALPWALEQATPPQSVDGTTTIGIDAAMRAVERLNLPKPFSLALPIGPRGAYMASYLPDRAEATRIVYLDQYTGRVIGDVGFAQYGPAAKAIAWGIAVHQGQEYGPLNRALMLGGCLAIILMAIAAVAMWWKRRPSGTLGVPPPPADPRLQRGFIAIVGVVGLIYPLVGGSILAAWAVERLISRKKPLAIRG